VEVRRYHHGNLKATLIEEAEGVLRARGIDAVSLRDLARQAGVSHGAPRRHFVDRQALLDAVAEDGFLKLSSSVGDAIDAAGSDYCARLRAAATAFVRFATDDPALLDLMFAAKMCEPPRISSEASEKLFCRMDDLIAEGQAAGKLPPGEPERVARLLKASVQGIATMVASGAIDRDEVDELISDSVSLLTNFRPD
jgi:AcrR family transcriptional regulator